MTPSPTPPHRAARRAVALTMLVVSTVMVSAILWGIVDELLGRGGPPPRAVDLARLVEELDTLEREYRGRLAATFASRPTEAPDLEWSRVVGPLQRRLDRVLSDLEQADATTGPAGTLHEAARALEETFHATGLIWERHRADARVLHRRAVHHLERARRAIAADPSDEGPPAAANGRRE